MANEIRTSFLLEFTKQLALNYINIKKNEPLPIPALEKIPARGQIAERQEIAHTEYETLGPRQIISIKEIEPYDPNSKRVQTLGLVPSIKPKLQEPTFIKSKELAGLYELLADVTVESIECPGPEKNIIIKQKGKVVETSTQLKKEDVEGIISEFSNRSGSKSEEGILKTKVENLTITAVASKFAGSRFVITKSNL